MNRGYIYLIITVLFFSTYEVVGRTLTGIVNPVQINFIRFFIGGLILLPIAIKNIKRKNLHITLQDFTLLVFIGLTNVVFSMSFLQIGINMTSASLSAVIFSSNPLFVMIAASLILNEKLDSAKIYGLILGIIGLVIVFYKQLMSGGNHLTGIVLLVLSSIMYGVYTVLGKKFTVKFDSVVMNSFSFIIGSLLLMPLLLYNRYPIFSLPAKAVPQMLYLTVFVTGIAYYTYFLGLSSVNTGVGSMVFFAKPILASIIAAIFLSEKITIQLVIGTIVILIGILIVQRDNIALFSSKNADEEM
ncbi:DMT family transporter [Thermoanaerobacterium sp. RBIITD]|uniref:DMT family transporter n=1 Tax=Thermoanaerobacterium sp. RBIITD TaxID=1550240 RepID=UPI000BB74007|nr:DMT family transporter [Thermoanaerobacterium sp. RBIITD]SNX55190.1 Permease of the drug/metabolite transporter (DMT) superfamily [Thermoanaerobacterium sp. RBIITD]